MFAEFPNELPNEAIVEVCSYGSDNIDPENKNKNILSLPDSDINIGEVLEHNDNVSNNTVTTTYSIKNLKKIKTRP